MIKVLYTVNGLRVNGMSAVIMHYISGLKNKNYTFYIFTDEVDASFRQELDECNVKVIQSGTRRKNQIKYFKELKAIILKEKIDIIHSHGNSATIAVEMLAAKQCGVEVRIAHSHNTTCDHKVIDKLLRPLLYSTYTYGIGCGIEAGKWMFGNHKHQVIKNGIQLEKYRFDKNIRRNVRKSLGIEDKFVLGHVGRFTEQKNHAFLLQVLKKICEIKGNTVLMLIGDGPLEGTIRLMVRDNELEEHVIFIGTTNRVSDYYSAMDIFVFPSKYEGVPLTLVEAQANGLKCLIGENISDEVVLTDRIQKISIYNENAWVEKILKLDNERRYESNEEIKLLRKAGFDEDKVVESIDNLYNSQVSSKGYT